MDDHPRKILVVEDNPVTQRLYEKMFTNSGYKVLVSWNEGECLETAKRELPDAILMDVILPGANGKDVARKLKDDPETKDIPIVFVTTTLDSRTDTGNEIVKIKGQAHRIFSKPFNSQKILSVIRKEINRRQYGGEMPKEVEEKIRKK